MLVDGWLASSEFLEKALEFACGVLLRLVTEFGGFDSG